MDFTDPINGRREDLKETLFLGHLLGLKQNERVQALAEKLALQVELEGRGAVGSEADHTGLVAHLRAAIQTFLELEQRRCFAALANLEEQLQAQAQEGDADAAKSVAIVRGCSEALRHSLT